MVELLYIASLLGSDRNPLCLDLGLLDTPHPDSQLYEECSGQGYQSECATLLPALHSDVRPEFSLCVDIEESAEA